MVEVVFGALALFGAASLFSRATPSARGDSFGADPDRAPGFTPLGNDGKWLTFEYSGPSGSFTVAVFPSADGNYPHPEGSNVEFEYDDGIAGRSIRSCGPRGLKWADVDLPGTRKYDLFVYHPMSHPGDFPTSDDSSSYGAVSWWQGGRGPRAGSGTSSVGGGRQVGVPYAFSSSTESGYENFKHKVAEDPQAEWVEEFGAWRDPETGQCWSENDQAWITPEEMGFTILGLTIPTSKEERMERLDTKIEAAQSKLKEFEKAAKVEGADIDKLAKQIASLQAKIDKWEEKRTNIEVKMAGLDDDVDDMDDEIDEDQDDEDLLEDVEDDLFGEDLEELGVFNEDLDADDDFDGFGEEEEDDS